MNRVDLLEKLNDIEWQDFEAAENAGSGFDKMFSGWKSYYHTLPNVSGDFSYYKIEFPLKGKTEQVTEQVLALIKIMEDHESTLHELIERLKLRHRPTFLYNYLQPAIDLGLIEMTIPDKPKSSKQKYRLTAKGKAYLKSCEDSDK